MKALHYKVKTLAPVIISTAGGEANLTGTMDYLSGSSILGVFASRYLAAKGDTDCRSNDLHKDERFYRWFLRGDLSFGNAYLIVDGEDDNTYQFDPTPLSLQQDKEDEDNVYNLTAGEREGTKALGGFFYLKGNNLFSENPEKQLFFHHARKNRLKGRSEEGEIFYYEALSEGQHFVGRILGDEKELEEFKEYFGHDFLAWVGRSKNAQYGQIKMVLGDVEEVEKDDLTEIIDYGDNCLVLTFSAPVILRNQYGYPEVSVGVLKDYLVRSLGRDNFDIEECYARSESVENYVSVWKLKKPAEKALAVGSTFKLSFEQGLDDELLEKIKTLRREGLGERRNEGFGRLMINPAAEKRYLKEKLKTEEPEKPKGALPEEAREIFQKIILNQLEKEIEKAAIEKSKEFFSKGKNTLSNSLLGRLELMLRESKNWSEFSQKLNQLRKTARSKLEEYHDKKVNLYDALLNCSLPVWERFLDNVEDDITKLAEKGIGWNLKKDQALKEKLSKNYWLAFFRNTRKLNKMKGEEA